MAYHITLYYVFFSWLSYRSWPFFVHSSTEGVSLTLLLGTVKYVCSSSSGVECGHNSGELK